MGWSTKRSAHRHIRDKDERIGRAAEWPHIARRKIRRGHYKKRFCGVVNVKLNHVGRPDLAVDMERGVDLLARRKGERSSESTAPRYFGVDGGSIAGCTRAGDVRGCGPVLHNVGFADRRPRDASLRAEHPERGPQSCVRWHLNAGFDPA